MVVVVRGRRSPAAGVATGLLVGGAIARNRQAQKQNAQMQAQQAAATQAQINQANANAALAKEEAKRARAEAERAKAQTAQAPQTAQAQPTGGMMTMNVVVPQGVSPGMPFNIQANGTTMTVTCPANAQAGTTIAVQVPAPQAQVVTATPQVVTATPQTLSATSSGKDLFREAILDASAVPPPPALGNTSNQLVLINDHIVDENAMKAYNIISVNAGTCVTLVEGTLENGLGGAYKDYIKVMVPVQGGRTGLISRLVVQPAPSAPMAGPPPAIGL